MKVKPSIIYVKDSTLSKSVNSFIESTHKDNQAIVKSIDRLNATAYTTTKEDKVLNHFTYDTIFTVTITLFVFVLGIVIDRLIKRYESVFKKNKLKRYFKYYLDKLTDRYSLRLAELYKMTYQSTDINSGFSLTPPKILTGDFNRIQNINDHELFNSIKQSASLSAILSHLDFIEKITHEVEYFHSKIRVESDEIRKPLQKTVNDYFTLLAKYVEHVRVNNPSYNNRDEFRDLVNGSILSQAEISKTNLKKVYKDIVRPIQKMVVETNIFRLDPVAKEIADFGKAISQQYNYIKDMTIAYRLEYRKFYNAIIESQKVLVVERDKIKWPKQKN